jgi:hypothetical protein
MKKLILLTLMTVTLLTLVSCNTNNETSSNASVLTSITNDLPSDEVVETEIVSEVNSSEIVTTETSVKTFAVDHFYTDDSVVFELESANYDEKGALIVNGYIVNVTDHLASNMRLKKLEIFNENDEKIASNCFGYIQEYYGACFVGERLEISFTFPSINVYIKDGDLDSVSSVSSFTSEH